MLFNHFSQTTRNTERENVLSTGRKQYNKLSVFLLHFTTHPIGADVVLMDDKPSKIALAIRIARRTLSIARQNVVFAIGVKVAVLVLAAFGIATMWLAVFADVGVTVLAVLNAMRALRASSACHLD